MKKKSMTSLDLAAVVSSLTERLRGARLSNIYGVAGVYLFKYKSGAGDTLLLAEPGVRLHATSYTFTSKPMPSPFVMALRKHVRGRRLRELGQLGFDRIAYMVFDNNRKIYVELIPRGFLVLVDEEELVLQANRYARMRDRAVTRGVKYTPPPRGLDPRSPGALERVREVVEKTSNPKKASRILGLPYELMAEAYARGGSPRGTAEAILDVIREAVERHRGYIVVDREGRPTWLLSFKPTNPEAFAGVDVREYSDINDAADEYFLEETRRLLLGGVEGEAEERLRASLEKALERLKELEERIKEAREEAYTVSQHVAEITEAWECVRRVREIYGWERVTDLCPGVVAVEPGRGCFTVVVAGRRIKVPVTMTPYQWVNQLYRRLGELEKKKERGMKAVEELKEKIEELARRMAEKRQKALMTVRRREWYEKYHWMFTSSWLLVIGGRDASQNESVVRKHLGENDVFMHADIHGAPAVIVKTGGREPPEQDLREAAVIAACYSKAWKGGAGAVDVYWVYGRQVSKHPPSGEYLAKGAFMVYGKRNYIRAVELRLAIGVADDEGSPLVIVGPQHIVERRSIVYAVLAPGDEDPSRLAKRLHRLFRQKLGEADERVLVEALNPEEIRQRIPGRSRVLTVRRGSSSEPPRPPNR